jgi:hypothetical protein
MNLLSRKLWASLLSLLFVASVASAQSNAPAERAGYSQAELDQMLAPIALYPDSLLSQVLMAATYPLEIVQAARWARANPGISGEQAVRAVDDRNWDPSVKSLVAFPQVVTMMDEKLDWTEKLGDAFLGQESQVMQTVQALRERAYAAGNLRSDPQVSVQREGETIVIDSPQPDVMYVPYYDPTLIYGPWWWPQYPPVYWRPWPGYFIRGGPAFSWGFGVSIGGGFFFGGFDWRVRHVTIVNPRPFYYHGDRGHVELAPGNAWRHDPDHRRGVPYRDPSLRQRYGNWTPSPDARREYRGREQPGEGRSPVARPAPDRRPPSTQPYVPPSAQPQRPAPADRIPRVVPERPPTALEGVGRGHEARESSVRGQQSTQGQVPGRAVGAPAPSRPAVPPAQAPAPHPSGGAAPSRPSGGEGHHGEVKPR